MPSKSYIEVNKTTSKNTASTSPTKKLGERIGNVENITQAVLWVGIISLISVVVAVTAMVIDQFHFNNQTYQNQSDKNASEFKELNARIDTLQAQLSQQQAQPTRAQ